MTVDPFIEAEEVAGHSVQNACRLLEVSRAAYYQRRNGVPRPRGHRRRAARADRRHPHRVQGHLWIPPHPQGAGSAPGGLRTPTGDQAHALGRTRRPVQETMEEDHRRRSRRRVGPGSHSGHFGPCAEIDRRYVGDITYIATWEGWAYLATVIDLASRRVVGWALADHMRTELVEDALSMAFAHRAPEKGVIFHSDRGCQYTSRDFAELARTNGVVLSVGRKGECWDNAVAESFFATIKRELIDTRSWPTRTGLRRGGLQYIEGWYNTRRLHSTLGYLSPAQYEAAHHNADLQAA